MKEIVLTNDSTIYGGDWVQDVEVIPLETSDKALVGMVDGVIATDSNIIIYDWMRSQRVFIFNRDGKHRATINRSGRGPQEYVRFAHVAMLPDNQTLAIHDNGDGKVLFFSLDGRFISSIPMGFGFSRMEYLDENKVVCAKFGSGENDPGLQEYENRTDLLFFTDNKFGIKGSAIPLRYKDNLIISTPVIWKSGEQVYAHRPFSDTIYQALPNSLKAIYRLNIEPIGG
ncbi:MAG: 6-bladed beta-propeller, partial [Culturomica sp.]|nr:6-bladed beta-propeller [Culturomica sp.]